MWKAPYRTKREITQSFNDGVVGIYDVQDAAQPGYKPVKRLLLKEELRFEEQRLGIARLYQSRQVQAEIEKVIRVPKAVPIHPQDIAVIEGEQYRIDSVQKVMEVYPPCLDLALIHVKQKFEVMP